TTEIYTLSLHTLSISVVQGLAELVVAVADLQAEVVEPDPASRREAGGVLVDLDEQEFVVGTPGRRGEGRGPEGGGRLTGTAHDLAPAEHVPVERRGAIEVANVE